jgi:proline iminopeptidase
MPASNTKARFRTGGDAPQQRWSMNHVKLAGLRRRPGLTDLSLVVFLATLTTTAHAQDHSFQSQGVELHYRTAGSGTPLVLLSGGPGFDVDYMLPVSDFLPAGYQRIFLEQRGTGRSRVANMTAENMTLQVVVEDLEALRVHLKQERLLLLGHSWGGMLAMAYAAAHPDRIDRMILIGSGGPTLEFAERFTDNIAARLRPEDVEGRRHWESPDTRGADPEKAAVGAMKAILPGYFFDRTKALAFAAELKDGSFHPAVNSLLMRDLNKSYDLRAGLREVDRPILIIQGYQDPVSDKTADDIHALLLGSTLRYINQSGHFPWIEQPEEFRRAISGFLVPASPTRD